MIKLSIVIPVFNECDTILSVVDSVIKSHLEEMEKEVILVDDGSTDGTTEIVRNLGLENKNIQAIFNEKNMGKGSSIRKGLGVVNGEYCIIQDADLEYNPDEYKRLLEPLMTGEADAVYGSRFLGKPFALKTYYIANIFLTFLSNVFTGLNLTDMETCYKCLTRKSLSQILPHLKADRFDIEPEITHWLAKQKLKIVEVPISYARRSYAQGKKIGFGDGLAAIRNIITN